MFFLKEGEKGSSLFSQNEITLVQFDIANGYDTLEDDEYFA